MNIQSPETLKELTHHLARLLEIAPCLQGIRSEQEYNKALETTEALLRTIGDNPNDPRQLLMEIITRQLEAYEYRTHPVLSQWDKQDGVIALLKTLLRQYDLTQSDIPEIVCTQKVLH